MNRLFTQLYRKYSKYPERGYHRDVSTDIGGFFLSLYVGTSPVYWFWTLPVEWVNLCKITLFVLASGWIWLAAMMKGEIYFPRSLAGPLGFVLLLFVHVFTFFQSEPSVYLPRCLDILYGYVMLWSVYSFVRIGGDIRLVLSAASLLLLPFCGLTITYALFGFPDWGNPYIPYLDSSLGSGFGGGRTGWSNGIALFLPIALLSTGFNERPTRYRWIVSSAIVIFLIIGSQLLAGGRAGLLASFVALMILSLLGRLSKKLWFLLALMAMVGYYTIGHEWLFQHLRFGRLENIKYFSDLNYFSAFRIEQFFVSFSLILEHPLYGHGIVAPEVFGLSNEIHNVWLRMAVQAGVLAPAVFAVIVYVLFKNAFRMFMYQTESIMRRAPESIFGLTLLSTLLSGLIISMFEPNAIVGSFQNSALWWVAAGAAAALVKRPALKCGALEKL